MYIHSTEELMLFQYMHNIEPVCLLEASVLQKYLKYRFCLFQHLHLHKPKIVASLLFSPAQSTKLFCSSVNVLILFDSSCRVSLGILFLYGFVLTSMWLYCCLASSKAWKNCVTCSLRSIFKQWSPKNMSI